MCSELVSGANVQTVKVLRAPGATPIYHVTQKKCLNGLMCPVWGGGVSCVFSLFFCNSQMSIISFVKVSSAKFTHS